MDNKINNEEEKIYYVKRIEKFESNSKIVWAQLMILSFESILAGASRIILPDLYQDVSRNIVNLILLLSCLFSYYKMLFESKKAAKKLEEMEGKTK